MAADAFKGLEKKMDAAKEAEIAAYIMRDIELRQENAKESGVLAYGRKPIPRSKLNERFLQNTLKSVSFANRKAAEDEMWDKWNRMQGRKRDSWHSSASPDRPDAKRRRSGSSTRRKSSRRSRQESSDESACSSASPSSGSDLGDKDSVDPVDNILSRRAVRGRGAVGSRAEETGPFLFPTDQQELEEYEMMRLAQRKAAGPDCPMWIRQQNATDSWAEGLPNDVPSKERKAAKERKDKKKAKKLKKEKKRRRKERLEDSS